MCCNREPIVNWMKVRLILNTLVSCLCTSDYDPDSGRIKCFRIRGDKGPAGLAAQLWWQSNNFWPWRKNNSPFTKALSWPQAFNYLIGWIFYNSNYYSLMCESVVTFCFIITVTVQLFMGFYNTTYSRKP